MYKFYDLNQFVKALETLRQKTRLDLIDTRDLIKHFKNELDK